MPNYKQIPLLKIKQSIFHRQPVLSFLWKQESIKPARLELKVG
jgi:hypothetical protein